VAPPGFQANDIATEFKYVGEDGLTYGLAPPVLDRWSGSWTAGGETTEILDPDRPPNRATFGTLTLRRLPDAEGRARIETFNEDSFLPNFTLCGSTGFYEATYDWAPVTERYPDGGEILACEDFTRGERLEARYEDATGGGLASIGIAATGSYTGSYTPVYGAGSCPSGIPCRRQFQWEGQCRGGSCISPQLVCP
jgi:hypothetical protein